MFFFFFMQLKHILSSTWKTQGYQNVSNFSLPIFCFAVPLKSHLHYSIFRVIVQIILFAIVLKYQTCMSYEKQWRLLFHMTTDLEWCKWDLRAVAEGNNDLIFSHFPTQNCHLVSEDWEYSKCFTFTVHFWCFLCHFWSSHSLSLSMIIFQNFSFLFF